MSHAYDHAVSSAKIHGGVPEDYLKIHLWFDEMKSAHADFRSRILRHHAEGIRECTNVFGITITNSEGKPIPVSILGEQHVREDCGWVPSFTHWAEHLQKQPWMNSPTVFRRKSFRIDEASSVEVTNEEHIDNG